MRGEPGWRYTIGSHRANKATRSDETAKAWRRDNGALGHRNSKMWRRKDGTSKRLGGSQRDKSKTK